MKLNEKSFNSTIKNISKNSEALAQDIHNAACFALAQANEHGNIGFGTRLLEAMGKKHDVKRVEKWLCHFGKFGMKKGELVYRARRDILPENLEAQQAKAEALPYWELTEQEHHKFVCDGLGLLRAAMNKYANAQGRIKAGIKDVEIKNEAVFAEVQALLDKFTPKPAPAVVEEKKTSKIKAAPVPELVA